MEDKHRVTILPTGAAYSCKHGESIMEAMERAGGREIFVGCRRGGCGACKVRVAEGSVELLRPMSKAFVSEAEQQEGSVLACCVCPTGDVVIDTE